MNSIDQKKHQLARKFDRGEIGRNQFEDHMFELERTPQGQAECPDCGSTKMYFQEHICGWRCPDCGSVRPTSHVRIINSPHH